MTDEWYTPEKHAKTMERVFESIHDIHLIVTRNEGRINEVKDSVTRMSSAIDGEGSDEGIKGMVGTIRGQMNNHWKLILGGYAFTMAVGSGLFMWVLWWHK